MTLSLWIRVFWLGGKQERNYYADYKQSKTKRNGNPASDLMRGRSNAVGMVMKSSCFIAALVVVMFGMPFSSIADPPLVYNVENTGANYVLTNFPTLGQLPLVQPLPDPFIWFSSYTNGTFNSRSTNFVDWEHHRNEIAALIQNYEIGAKPVVDPTNISASYSGGTLTVLVTNNNQVLTLTCPVTLPSGSGPFPVCIGMDSPYGALPSSFFTSRNIAGITYYESQVTTYSPNCSAPPSSDPFFKLYGPAQNTSNTGQYAAWAWGVSRIIDGLYKLNGVLGTAQIDLNHIAVTGCSYAGKLALFAGAFDERIALTIAQESGGGGANSWRYNHTELAGSVEDLDNTCYYWFSSSRLQQFSGNNVSYLPDDHHELDAMVAPRALYVTGNTDYTWLGNPSCYVCSQAAQQIYNTLGIPDRFGFNVDGGHSHCAFPNDQTNDLAYFLDKFMLSKTNLSSVIATYPSGYSTIDYARWYQWWGTTNPAFPYNGQLSLLVPNSATEGDGTLAGAGHVSVSPIPTNAPVIVYLTSSNTNKVVVPASVVIPVGQGSAVFDVTIIDNSILDGDQYVNITASSPVCNDGPQSLVILVHDNETATLSVTLPASASESAGTLTNAGSVSIGTVAGANFTVSLTSSDPSQLIVPATTIISMGQTSAVFNLTLVSNNIIEGPQIVTVTAHVPNWTDGSNSMTIFNTTPLPDHFAWSAVPSPQLMGAPFAVTITAQDSASNTLDYRLPVTLSALAPGNGPGTNTILNSPTPENSYTNKSIAFTVGYSFTPDTSLTMTHVRSYFGNSVSIWTAAGQLLVTQSVVSVPGTWVDTPLPEPLILPAGRTYVITAREVGTQYFWSTNLPTTFADGTIGQSYLGVGNVFFSTTVYNARWFFVDLRYATNFVTVPVNPDTTADFSSGTWSGNLVVLQTGTNMLLQASAGAGNSSGFSNPFNVIGLPELAITAVSNSVVLSWPVAAAGFNLEQSSTLSNWTTVPVIPAVVGDQYNVTNTIGPDPTYYRLHMP